jgi:hypothetical protein
MLKKMRKPTKKQHVKKCQYPINLDKKKYEYVEENTLVNF